MSVSVRLSPPGDARWGRFPAHADPWRLRRACELHRVARRATGPTKSCWHGLRSDISSAQRLDRLGTTWSERPWPSAKMYWRSLGSAARMTESDNFTAIRDPG